MIVIERFNGNINNQGMSYYLPDIYVIKHYCCNVVTNRKGVPLIKPVVFFIAFLLFCPGIVLGECHPSGSKSHNRARFKLMEAEALDLTTNLIWSRCSLGARWKKGIGCVGTPKAMRLDDAKKLVQKLGNGWRIPTIEELYGIVETKCSNPAIDTVVFPDVKNLGEGLSYWSISRMKELPKLVYYVDFMNGQVDAHSGGFVMAVRPVRNSK